MTIERAMRIGLITWLICLIVSSFALMISFLSILFNETAAAASDPPMGWFFASAVMLGFVVPMCFMAHWTIFRRHWSAGYVQPGGYLQGFVILWGGLTATAVVIALGAFMRNTVVPDIALAVPTVMLLMISWPSGWSMTHATTRIHEDDVDVMHTERRPHEP
jgi:hypothetical protein